MGLIKLPCILAAGAIPAYMTEIVAVIVAGALIAYICFRLRLVPIVGFLLAGVLIGPNALGLVRDQALVDATAEIGVILLLFTIGIEFSLEKLARIQRLIFGGGILQVGSCVAVTTALLALFGIDWRVGIFTGFLVGLSSTAIVLKLLGDSGETNSETGQVGLGLLIFQDLAIVVMVLLVPTLGGGEDSGAGIAWALAKAVLIIAAVLLIARRVMPPVLEAVAKTCSPELFLLSVIAICFGTAFLTSLAGVSLSLGAFLAGLMVSESRFSHHALSETLPLQILFSATFFVSVGMLLDVSFLVQNLPLVLTVIAVVLIVKILTTGVSVFALGYKLPVAAASALMLAQIGEFSFVLERAGREAGLSPSGMGEAGSQTFIASTVALMVLTPFLMKVGERLSHRLTKHRETVGLAEMEAEPLATLAVDLEDHVIVAGYGRAARCLVRVLNGSEIPFIITTLSPEGANEADAEGLPVIRGDSTKPFLLRLAGVDNAKMMVIADDNPSMTHRIASVARQLNPTMRIVVRTRYIAEVEHLAEAGADVVIAEELESVVQLFGEVLHDYRIPAERIEAYEEMARRDGYAALFDDVNTGAKSAFACETDEDCLDSRTVTVRESTAIAGKSLAALDLAKKGLNVTNISRDGIEIAEPAPDFVLQPGDEIVLSGQTNAFAANANLFRPAARAAAAGAQNAAIPETDADRRLDVPAHGRTVADVETMVKYHPSVDASVCSHLGEIRPVYPSAPGCEECLQLGDDWVHLRLCLTCGHVGCCDTSKNKHATAHFHETDHPIMKSLEPADDWAWCFPDETYV